MRITGLAAGIAGLLLSAGTAIAVPAVKHDISPPSDASGLQLVNGTHRSCARGPAGWHYHVRGERISCEDRPSGRYWGWQLREGRWGWWHSRERRWNSGTNQR